MGLSRQNDASSAQEGDFSAAGIKIDLLGFAFHPTWIYLLFFSTGSIGAILGSGENVHGLPYLASVIPLALVNLAGIVLTKRVMAFATNPIASIAAPLATSLGTLVYVSHIVAPSPAGTIIAGVLTGVGSALLAARWAALFGRFGVRTVTANFPILMLLQVALCLTMTYLADVLQVVLLVSLPLANGFWLFWSEKRSHRERPGKSLQKRATASDIKLAIVFVACVSAIGFLAAQLGAFGRSNNQYDYGAWFDIAVSALALLVAGQLLFSFSRKQFPFLFLLPLGCLMLLLIPQTQLADDFLADIAYPIGAVVFELLLLFASTLFARARNASPARIYMAARFFYAASDIVGTRAGEAIASHVDLIDIAHSASIMLMAGIGLLVTIALVVFFAYGTFPAKGNAGSDSALASEGAGNQADPPSSCNDAPSPHDAILSRCHQLRQRFGLSEREEDVLVLIAEGRSSSRIQEDLSISAGTVNYHTRNIYAKIGVHSRQEIIDFALKGDIPEPDASVDTAKPLPYHPPQG